MHLLISVLIVLTIVNIQAMEIESDYKPEKVENARLGLCIYRPKMILGYCGYHKEASVDWMNANMGSSLGYNTPLVTAILQKGDSEQPERIYFPLALLIELAYKKHITFKWKSDKKNDGTLYQLESTMYANGLRSECKMLIDNTYEAFLQMQGSGYLERPLHISREDKHRSGVSKFYKITIGYKPSSLLKSEESFNFIEPNKIVQPIKNFLNSQAGSYYSEYATLRNALIIGLESKHIIEKEIEKKHGHGPNGYPAFINAKIIEENKNRWLKIYQLHTVKDSYFSKVPSEIIINLYYFLNVIKEDYKIYADLCRYHCEIEYELMMKKIK